MSAGRVILGGTLAAVAYLVWTNRTQAAPEAVYMPAVQPVQDQPRNNFLPLFEWGLNMLSGNKSTNTGADGKRRLLPGFFTNTSAKASPSGATASGGVNVQGLLNLIGKHEAPAGYNQVYGGTRLQPPQPITSMTVGEVLNWQSRSVAAGSASSAAGRYQFIRPTLSDLVSKGHVRRDDYFDQATQDRLGRVLMERRGLSSYQQGRISAERFANNLAREWASLPVVTGAKRGRSYYAGDGLNKALTTPEAVLAQIKGGGWI